MGWTAPRTWVTGEVVTAAIMNTHVRDNLNALEGYLDDVTHSEPARALDTVYINNTGKIRLVTITCLYTNNQAEILAVLCDSSNPPTITIAESGHDVFAAGADRGAITFIVPPNYYYKALSSVGTPTLREWHEWDLLH